MPFVSRPGKESATCDDANRARLIRNPKPQNPIMTLSRKDFLRRSGAVLLPISFAGAATSLAGQKSSLPTGLPVFNVRQFGARGDGQAKDTRAIQAAVDAAAASGGTVCLPPGQYLSGTVRF